MAMLAMHVCFLQAMPSVHCLLQDLQLFAFIQAKLSVHCLLQDLQLFAFFQAELSVHCLLQDLQLCGLSVLSALPTNSEEVNASVLNPSTLVRLHALIREGKHELAAGVCVRACSVCGACVHACECGACEWWLLVAGLELCVCVLHVLARLCVLSSL
jgi:hypothetical protein